MNDPGLILNIEGFDDFKAGMDALKKLAKDIDSTFTRTAKAVNTFVESLNPAPLKAFNKLLNDFDPAKAGLAIREFAETLSTLKTTIDKLGKTSDTITKFSTGLLAFASGLRQIVDLANTSAGRINTFTVSLRLLFDLVEKRGKALTQLNKNILSFDASQTSLRKISENLNNLVPNASEVKLSFFGKIQQAVAGLQNGAGPIKQLVGGLKELQGLTINGFFGRGAGDKLIQIGNVLVKVKDNFQAFAKSLEPGRLAFRNVLDLVSAFKQLENIDIGSTGSKGFTRFNFFGSQSSGLISQFERLGGALLKFKDQLGAFGTTVSPGAAALRALQPFVTALKSLNEIQVGRSFLGFSTGLVGQINRLGTALNNNAGSFKAFGNAIGPVTRSLPLLIQQFEKLSSARNLKAGDVFKNLKNAFANFKLPTIPKSFINADELVTKAFDNALKGVRSGKPFLTIGKELVSGLTEGLKPLGQAGAKAASDLIKSIKSRLGIQSPSTVMAGIGRDLVSGLRGGLTGLLQLGTNIASGFISGFKNAILGLPGLVKGAFDQVGNQLRQASENLRSTGQNLIQSGIQQVVSGGVAGFISGRVMSQVADFDQVSNQIRIFGRLAEDELASVRNDLLTFSADTIFDPQQSALAFLGLQKAGLSLQQSLAVLPEIGNLAAAGELSLEQSTQAVIQAAKTFNIAIEDSARITNAYQQAADNSTVSVSDLQQGIANVGPIASQFNLSFEETLAILSLFGEAGIKGAEAGTNLKSMLVGITRPTKEVQDAFQKLNVSLTDATGNFRPFNDVINDLSRAMNETQTVTVRVNNLSSEQAERLKLAQNAYASASRQIAVYNDGLSTGALESEASQKQMAKYQQVLANAQSVIAEITGSQAEAETITKEITRTQAENFRTIQELAGSFGGTGLSVLLAQDEDAIASFVDEMKTLPTAAEIASEMMNTFKGRVESLRGSIQTLAIRALSPLQQKVLTPLIDKFIGFINRIGELPEGVLAAAGGVVLLTTAIVTLSGVFSIASGAILTIVGTALGPLVTIFTTMTAILFNPIGVLAGIAGIASSLLLVIPVVAAFGAAVFVVFNAVNTAISDIQNNVGGAGDSFNALRDSIGPLFETIGGLIRDVISLIPRIGGSVNEAEAAARGSRLALFFDGIREKIEAITRALQGARDFLGIFASALGIEIASPEVDNTKLERRNQLLEEIKAAQEGINVTSQAGETITIKAGDTLSQLAQQYDTTVAALAELNNISDPNKIFAGDQLVIKPAIEIDETATKTSVDRLRAELRDLDTERVFERPVEQIDTLQSAIDKFAETPIFERIFGDPNDANKTAAIEAFTKVREEIQNITSFGADAKTAISQIFSGEVTEGIAGLKESIKGIGKSLLDAVGAFGAPEATAEDYRLFNLAGVPISSPTQFQAMTHRLVEGIRGAIDDVRNFSFSGAISGIFTTIQDSITNFNLDGFKTSVQQKFAAVRKVFDDVLGGIFGASTTPLFTTPSGATLAGPDGILPATQTQGFFSEFIDRLVADIQNTVKTLSFPDLQSAFEDKFTTIISILGVAAGIVFPPAGIALTAVKLLGGAIEADFLGIGTFIDESGIRSAVEGVFNSIRDMVSGIFAGGSIDLQTPGGAILAGPDGLIPAPEQSPIVKTITQVIDAIKKAVDLFGPEVQESFSNIQTGIKGFFDNLGAADTSGIDNVVAFLLKVAGGLAAIGGVVLATGLDIVTDIFENVLPEMGRAISGLISAVSALGNGDPAGVISGIGTAISGLVNAFVGVGAGVADGLFDLIERITGIELPDVRTALEGWRTNLENAFFLIRVLFDNIRRGLERSFLDIKISILGALEDIINKVTDFAAGAGVDLKAIGIDFSGLSLGLTSDIQFRDELNFADAVAAEANRQLGSGEPIRLNAPFSFDGEALNIFNQDFIGQVSRAIEQGNLSVAGQESIKNLINRAIQEAIATGNTDNVQTLLPLADFFQIDTTGLVDSGKIQEAINLFNEQLADFGTENIDPANAQFAIDQILGLGATPEQILSQVDTEALKTMGVTVGGNVVDGLSQALDDPEGKISTAFTDSVTEAQSAVETILETQSPSQWAVRLGGFVLEGLAIGLTNGMPLLDVPLNEIGKRFEVDLSGAVQRGMTSVTNAITSAQAKINIALLKIGQEVDKLASKLAAFQDAVTGMGEIVIPTAAPVQGNWRGGIHQRGLGWIGERGPELVFSDTSMAVLNNRTSQAFATGMQWAMAEFGGARAQGGSVQRGRYYEVADGSEPEVLQSRNGRVYLLPSENGQINRLSDLRGASTVNQVDNSRHIAIDLRGSNGVTDADIARIKHAVREADEENQRNNSFGKRARLRGLT